jgi:hypothetical protein
MTGGSYRVRKVSKNANNGETTKEEATKTYVYIYGRIILKLVPESMPLLRIEIVSSIL